MVVLPDPVGPWMRKSVRSPRRLKSTTCSPEYGPKALVRSLRGLMGYRLPFPSSEIVYQEFV